jgi:hypothetical protein
MPGDIRSMKHWKYVQGCQLRKVRPVIFLAKPCARTGREKNRQIDQREVPADPIPQLKLGPSGSIVGLLIAE